MEGWKPNKYIEPGNYYTVMEQDKAGTEYLMIRKHSELRRKKVLEIGCGNGRASATLVKEAQELIAIDPDAGQIEIARKNVPGVDFRTGSGESLEFPNGAFDAVAFTFSLHHQDSVRALAEAYRVMKPGGTLLIIEPSVEGELHRFFRAFRDEDRQIAYALSAIENGPFSMLSSETFPIEWQFEDNEDLYLYFLEHSKTARTPEWIDKMNSLLGSKVRNRPILLTEMVTIFSLEKEKD